MSTGNRTVPIAMLAILAACNAGTQMDPSIKNKTVVATMDSMQAELDQLDEQAEQDSLSDEARQEIEDRYKERMDVVNEELKRSPHKGIESDSAIEAMLEDWLTTYVRTGAKADLDRITEGMGKDAVLKRWGDAHVDKRRDYARRVKEAKAAWQQK